MAFAYGLFCIQELARQMTKINTLLSDRPKQMFTPLLLLYPLSVGLIFVTLMRYSN